MNWDRLVREHGAVVFGVAWRILGHTADTEDVVQEVFLEAHRLQQTQAVKRGPGCCADWQRAGHSIGCGSAKLSSLSTA